MIILKVYSHPKAGRLGFQLLENKDAADYARECLAERQLDCMQGCSAMSLCETRAEAMEQARKLLGEKNFQACF